jgi:hypothetical protein
MLAKGQVLLRFLVLNIAGFALLLAAWLQGWIAALIEGDGTRISAGIALVFLAGLCLAGIRAARIDRALAAGSPSPFGYGVTSINAVRIRLGEELGAVRNIANALVFLGLIGTVVGIVIALSAVDPQAVSDPAKVAPMVAELVDGMGVALTKTLVGAVLHLWLSMNYRLIAGGATTFLATLIDRQDRIEG